MAGQHEQRPDGHHGLAGNQEAPAQVGKAGDRGRPPWGRPRCSLAQWAWESQQWHQDRGGGQHFNQALCCGLTPGLGSLCL